MTYRHLRKNLKQKTNFAFFLLPILRILSNQNDLSSIPFCILEQCKTRSPLGNQLRRNMVVTIIPFIGLVQLSLNFSSLSWNQQLCLLSKGNITVLGTDIETY